jgi:hypothetical protein
LAGNASNLTGNNSLENLWSWGKIPEGYSLENSEKPTFIAKYKYY